MTAPVDDPGVLPIAEQLLTCLTEAVATLAVPPRNVMLRPGTQAEFLLSTARDECCEGLAWVRLSQVYPSAKFPQPDGAYLPCYPVQYAAVFELGIVRCAPMTDAEDIPSADEWNTVTALVLNDAAAMRRAICCWTELTTDTQYLTGLWLPINTEGGCTGGIQTITIAIGACDCD